MLDVLLQYYPEFLKGLRLTLILVGLSVCIGFLLSLPIALARLSPVRPLRWLAKSYIFFFRGTPMLVQIFLLYYGLSQFESVKNSIAWKGFLESPFWCAVIAISCNSAAYMAEILVGGIKAVPRGQVEAGRAVGMSSRILFWRIILPQAIRIALPNYSNEVIFLVKSSALASTITLMELTGVTRTLVSKTYMPVPVYLIAGVLYISLNYTVAKFFKILERWLMPQRHA
jgi:His/Glu/Gln/Arg/opine family amino acid ABC transporter permease subunit